jgi:LysM repeat protein
MDNSTRLQRIHKWIGANTIGIYIGIESSGWRADTFVSDVLNHFGSTLPDYVIVKCGEYGTEWYDGTFPAIRQAFLAKGIGCAPYYFARPGYPADITICAKLAREAEGIFLDCEEQWANDPSALAAFVSGVRNLAGPDPVIIVSGYGDPITAVPNWDFHCLFAADAYQPQWYLGWWDLYRIKGFQAAIDWGDNQVANRFIQSGLGADYPIQPAINVEGVAATDFQSIANYLQRWQCSLAVWEFQDVYQSSLQALKSGMAQSVSLPTPQPAKRTYTVVAQDTLSSIAFKFHYASWVTIYNANRLVIGPNPNLIKPGEVLVLP